MQKLTLECPIYGGGKLELEFSIENSPVYNSDSKNDFSEIQEKTNLKEPDLFGHTYGDITRIPLFCLLLIELASEGFLVYRSHFSLLPFKLKLIDRLHVVEV